MDVRAERIVAVDELLKMLVEKTGLPEDTVKQAIPMLSGFLKGKAPPEASGAIDQFFGSQPPVEGISSVNDVGGLATFMSDKLGIPQRGRGDAHRHRRRLPERQAAASSQRDGRWADEWLAG